MCQKMRTDRFKITLNGCIKMSDAFEILGR